MQKALLVFVALFPNDATAEIMTCHSSDSNYKAEYAFRIEANKESPTLVWFAFDPKNLDKSPAEVLEHNFTGIVGSDGLGISSIMIRQRDEKGELMLPAFLTIDWTTTRLAVAYVPFISVSTLLVLRDDFNCQRLD